MVTAQFLGTAPATKEPQRFASATYKENMNKPQTYLRHTGSVPFYLTPPSMRLGPLSLRLRLQSSPLAPVWVVLGLPVSCKSSEIFNTYPMVISNKWEIVALNDIDPSTKVEDNKINLLVIVHPGLC